MTNNPLRVSRQSALLTMCRKLILCEQYPWLLAPSSCTTTSYSHPQTGAIHNVLEEKQDSIPTHASASLSVLSQLASTDVVSLHRAIAYANTLNTQAVMNDDIWTLYVPFVRSTGKHKCHTSGPGTRPRHAQAAQAGQAGPQDPGRPGQ